MIDVKNGEYRAYDAEGFPLKMGVFEKECAYFGLWGFKSLSVNIEESGLENKSKELIELLERFLSSFGLEKLKKI